MTQIGDKIIADKRNKAEGISDKVRQVEGIFRQGQTTRVAVRGAENKRKPIRVEIRSRFGMINFQQRINLVPLFTNELSGFISAHLTRHS